MSTMSRHHKRGLTACVALTAALGLVACGSSSGSDGDAAANAKKSETITIANQPGLSSSTPLIIAQSNQCLEKANPNDTIKWVNLASTAVIREAMLSNKVQVGTNGLTPFLVGWSKGFDAKIAYALSGQNIRVMVKDPKYQSMKDLLDGDGKLAMPSPDAIQALLIRKIAKDMTGNDKAAMGQIVAMDHPTAFQALISGQIAAHVASPPFPARELAQGARSLADAKTVFGSVFPIVVVARSGWGDSHPAFMKSLTTCLDAGRKLTIDEPEKAAQIMADMAKKPDQKDEYIAELTDSDLDFTYTHLAEEDMKSWSEAAVSFGMMSKAPQSLDDIVFKQAQS